MQIYPFVLIGPANWIVVGAHDSAYLAWIRTPVPLSINCCFFPSLVYAAVSAIPSCEPISYMKAGTLRAFNKEYRAISTLVQWLGGRDRQLRIRGRDQATRLRLPSATVDLASGAGVRPHC